MNKLSTGTIKSGPNDGNVYLRSEDEIGRITAELGRAAYEEYFGKGCIPHWDKLPIGRQKVWCRVALAVLIEKDKHV